MSIISVKNLSKIFKKPIRDEGLKGMIKSVFSRKYDEVIAVDNISFDIEEGEIVGYIGANGQDWNLRRSFVPSFPIFTAAWW